MCSVPTANRISPGVTPVVSCSAGGELSVGGGCRVDDEGADITDVGQVGEKLERVGERLARLHPALDLEGHDRAAALAART